MKEYIQDEIEKIREQYNNYKKVEEKKKTIEELETKIKQLRKQLEEMKKIENDRGPSGLEVVWSPTSATTPTAVSSRKTKTALTH